MDGLPWNLRTIFFFHLPSHCLPSPHPAPQLCVWAVPVFACCPCACTLCRSLENSLPALYILVTSLLSSLAAPTPLIAGATCVPSPWVLRPLEAVEQYLSWGCTSRTPVEYLGV